jgi:sugar-specific transcriptional regulator TrmB
LGYNTDKHEAFDLLLFLQQLGLTAIETKTYLCLLTLGQAKASTVAAKTGVIRPTVYRALDDLSKRGLVSKTLATPAVYRPTDPRRVLHSLLGEASARIERLRSVFGEALENLYSHASFPDEQVGEFKLLPDRRKLEPALADMIGRAQNNYSAVYSRWGMARVTRESPEYLAIAAAKKRNVEIRIVAEIDNSNIKQARALRRYVEIRNSVDIGFYLTLMDSDEVMIGPMLTDRDLTRATPSVDLWTNNKTFVQAMRDLFEKIWLGSDFLPRPV